MYINTPQFKWEGERERERELERERKKEKIKERERDAIIFDFNALHHLATPCISTEWINWNIYKTI